MRSSSVLYGTASGSVLKNALSLSNGLGSRPSCGPEAGFRTHLSQNSFKENEQPTVSKWETSAINNNRRNDNRHTIIFVSGILRIGTKGSPPTEAGFFLFSRRHKSTS
jgi:hypothetical protein